MCKKSIYKASEVFLDQHAIGMYLIKVGPSCKPGVKNMIFVGYHPKGP